MPILEIAPDLHLITGRPRYNINVYVMGTVLVDAGTRHSARNILRHLAGKTITAHALTHVHPDHQGASHQLCTTLNIPLWCAAAGRHAMESGDLSGELPDNWITRLLSGIWLGPGHPVARLLREGDDVAGFTVLETPGHAPSHIAFWRQKDGVLLLGDVLNNRLNPLGTVGLRVPPDIYTPDPALNRQSARKLAALRPRVVCFGHGPPLFNGDRFVEFVAQLPV
jgi:glyoxylase-like metal-dependent hydrolase (beta-lactamase superfamily II)